MSDKPEAFADWATDTENNGANNSPNKVEPTLTKKTKGWGFPEKPPRGEWNWWMNKVGEWVRYLINPTYALRADTYTAEAGDKILPDNSAAALTINLPTSPSEGDTIYFRQKSDQLYSIYNLTVGRNGSTIMGLAEDMLVDSDDNLEFEMYYNGTTWIVIQAKVIGTTL